MSDTTATIFGATYLRISRSKGENEDTLQNHREIMASFCQQNGYSYETYEEIVSGGKYELEERPQLQRLLQNIEKYRAIFTVSLDRLSRNGLISQQIRQLCIENGIQIITPSQTFDLCNSLEDRVLYDVSSIFATLEYEMIGRRNKYNTAQRTRRGEYVSGKPAYGYRRNHLTRKLEIHEPEAEVVRYIFKLHSEGLGVRRITDMLNSEGYKPQLGHSFTTATVRRMLGNPVYKGCLVLHVRKRVKENGKYTFKVSDVITTDNAHPAIIAPEEWDQANRERTQRSEQAVSLREKTAVKSGTAMLKDLLFCGVCGRKLVIKKERNRAHFFIRRCEHLLPDSGDRCGNHGMKLKFLEEEILLHIQAYRQRLRRELWLLKRQELLDPCSELREQLVHLEYEMNENRKQQANLLELAAQAIFPDDELKDMKKSLLDQENALRGMKATVLQYIQEFEAFSAREQVNAILDLLDQFPFQTPEEQNITLKQFIRRINYTRVFPDEIQALHERNREREQYPFRYTIEYF
ncbi:recombinase family protein [Paenibacillus medicaginis]|uniref:Recombinase family protein n=1 Tax=Paenibacillus medicaginis TaxID=1470560 RepID=A0ABV5C4Z7_9BACL